MRTRDCSTVTHTRTRTRRRTRTRSNSCRDGSWGEVTLARVGGGDDDADGFLIETFETAVALQIFEVAADSAFFHELIELFLGDKPRGEEAVGAFAANLPALAFG